ncbi:jg1562 [Pararge aegeria aegeria]|uniref:Jg1562 protein n=1 Tax=Pararge aegeria aegeria TaxID=348720 RepID=A0A8S4RAM4_9NEOP|nr:jg1562 [Pararge aegeria aegeria]
MLSKDSFGVIARRSPASTVPASHVYSCSRARAHCRAARENHLAETSHTQPPLKRFEGNNLIRCVLITRNDNVYEPGALPDVASVVFRDWKRGHWMLCIPKSTKF